MLTIKKLIILIFSALLILSLTACGSTKSGSSSSSSSASTTSPSSKSSSSSSKPVNKESTGNKKDKEKHLDGIGDAIIKYQKNINQTYVSNGIKIKIARVQFMDVTKIGSDFKEDIENMGVTVSNGENYFLSIGYDVTNSTNKAAVWSSGLTSAVLSNGEQVNLQEDNLLSDYNPKDQTIQSHASLKQNSIMIKVSPNAKFIRLVPDEFDTESGDTISTSDEFKEIRVNF